MNACRRLIAFTLLTVFWGGHAKWGWACASAPPRGGYVQIADESAIIIWDSANKTQHFIRRATFTTQVNDFGFLVPTPTRPELAEADDEAFVALAKLTAPEVKYEKRPPQGVSCACSDPKDAAKSGRAPSVDVLEQKRVAGHDAAVLKADDAEALGAWLKEHGYEFSPELAEWVKPYVEAGWVVSAFKIAKDAPGAPGGESTPAGETTGESTQPPAASSPTAIATTALRMTFETDRPFFPYREPAPKPGESEGSPPSRLLRVFFLGDGRMQGMLDGRSPLWPGEAVWAGGVPADVRIQIVGQLGLKPETSPATWWLTEFEDHSSPRPAEGDLYFAEAGDQSPLKRPPRIHYTAAAVPEDAAAWALVACVAAPYFWARRRRQPRH